MAWSGYSLYSTFILFSFLNVRRAAFRYRDVRSIWHLLYLILEFVSACYSRYFAFLKTIPNGLAIRAILWFKKKITLMSVLFALFCVFEVLWRKRVIHIILRLPNLI